MMKTIVFALLIGTLAAFSALGLSAGKTDPAPAAAETAAPAAEHTPNLSFWADDEADIDRVSELYGIECVFREGHMALYYTEEDPQEVIARGDAAGWPHLEARTSGQLFG